MSRITARFLAGGVAVALAATGFSSVAVADTAPAAPTGSAVVTESNAFLQSAALNGVFIVPLPNASVAYDSTAGLATTLPVTGGDINLKGFYGTANLDGSLLFVDLQTGKSTLFKQLAFSGDLYRVTGVPVGGTDPVPLLKPAGTVRSSVKGTTQTVTSTNLTVDPDGAQYLDTQLNTTFFTAGQSVGSFSLTFNS